jgi:hypothetical protein
MGTLNLCLEKKKIDWEEEEDHCSCGGGCDCGCGGESERDRESERERESDEMVRADRVRSSVRVRERKRKAWEWEGGWERKRKGGFPKRSRREEICEWMRECGMGQGTKCHSINIRQHATNCFAARTYHKTKPAHSMHKGYMCQ